MTKKLKQNSKKLTAVFVAIVLALSVVIVKPIIPQVQANGGNSYFIQTDYDDVGWFRPGVEVPPFLRTEAAQAIARQRMRAAYREATEDMGLNIGTLARTNQATPPGLMPFNRHDGSVRSWRGITQGLNAGLLWEGLAIQEFEGGNNRFHQRTTLRHSMLVLGSIAPNMPAGVVYGEIFLAWTGRLNSNVQEWGYPIGNQFLAPAGSEWYGSWIQNFREGFAHIPVASNSSYDVHFIFGRSVNRATGAIEGAIIPEIPVGYLTPSNAMDIWLEGNSPESIAQMFEDAIDEFATTNVLSDGGFDFGIPSAAANVTRDGSILYQTFTNGDHRGNIDGRTREGKLVLSQPHGIVFPIFNWQMNEWGRAGGFVGAGFPLSGIFEDADPTVNYRFQVFSQGFMLIDELDFVEFFRLAPGRMDFMLEGYADMDSGYANIGSNFLNVYRYYNNAGGNLGIPLDNVRRIENTNIYFQAFGRGNYQTAYIMQAGAWGAAHLIAGRSSAIYNEFGFGVIGAPISNEFSTATGQQIQNFQNGYINITAGTFVSGFRVDRAGARISLDTADTAMFASIAFRSRVQSIIASGVDVYANHGGVVTIPGGGTFQRYHSSHGYGAGMMLINRAGNTFVVGGSILQAYLAEGGPQGAINTIGVPVGDAFAIDNAVFQNFTHGYFTHLAHARPRFVPGRNVRPSDGQFLDINNNFAEISIAPDTVGTFADIVIDRIPMRFRAGAGAAERRAAVRDAYAAEYDRLSRRGFYLGVSCEEQAVAWGSERLPPPGGTAFHQVFMLGDSTAPNFHGRPNPTVIFFNAPLNEHWDEDNLPSASSLLGEMQIAWLNFGSITGPVGLPLANQFFWRGNIYQNFTGGYIRLPRGSSIGAVQILNDHFDPFGQIGNPTLPGSPAYVRESAVAVADTGTVSPDDLLRGWRAPLFRGELHNLVHSLVQANYTANSWAAIQTVFNNAQAVLADPDATQPEINAAVVALGAAIVNLVSIAELRELVNQFNGVDGSDFTVPTWGALESALTVGASVLANPAATREAVNAAIAGLEQAIAGLVDLSLLRALIDEVESTTQGGYTNESWDGFVWALANAQGVESYDYSTRGDVYSAIILLQSAFDHLTTQAGAPLNTSALTALIALWENAAQGSRLTETWITLQYAVSLAKSMYSIAVAQSQIDDAYARLRTADEGLLDYQTLQNLVNYWVNTERGHNSYESWVALQETLLDAKAMLENGVNMTVVQFNTTMTRLQEAIDGLNTLDTVALRTLFDQWNNVTQGRYTDETWAALQEALAEARSTLDIGPGIYQDEIDAAYDRLRAAIGALESTSGCVGGCGTIAPPGGGTGILIMIMLMILFMIAIAKKPIKEKA